MKPIRSAAVTLGALALAFAAPSVALAHDGAHPFENCTEAYEAGYSNIPEGDEHYGDHLDRDQDGVGCDAPPSDFVPADDTSPSEEGAEQGTDEQASGQENPDLAETGGSSATPYYAAGGAAVLLAGAGVLVATRKRRTNN